MKKFFIGKQARIFAAGFCSAVCLAVLFYAVQPKAASGDDEAMLRELREMKAEISGLRQDFRLLLSSMGILDLRTEEEKAADEAKKQAAAEVSNVLTNLRGLKSASLMYFADNMETAQKPDFKPEISMLAQYMDRPDEISGGLYLFQKSGDGKWWVGLDLKAAGKTDELKARLADRAKSIGLYGAQDPNTPYIDQDIIWLQAR